MKKLSLLVMPLMAIPFLFSCNSSNKYDDTCPYLTFNALEDSGAAYFVNDEEDDVTVDVDIQYSTDKKTWNHWEKEHAVEIKKNGKLYIKNTKEHLSVGKFNYVQFVLSGEIAASGQISSLTAGNKIGEYEYCDLFADCNSLVRAPVLPATQLASYCCYKMFDSCTNLKEIPKLPATQLASHCYCEMFMDCTNLEVAPELPATQLAVECYYDMFARCVNLKEAPKLPATKLVESCYERMLAGCVNLKIAPELPATKLVKSCYEGMFAGCVNLKIAPELPATKLVESCYEGMFVGCSSLQKLEVGFGPDWPTEVYSTYCWLEKAGMSAFDPTFIWKGDAKIERDSSHVPSNWTIKHAD